MKRNKPYINVPLRGQVEKDAVVKAAADRGVTQARLVHRGLMKEAPELREVFERTRL